jgi:signal transduction histidine kinase
MPSESTAPDVTGRARPGRFTPSLLVGMWALVALSLAGKLVYLLPVKAYLNRPGAGASFQLGDIEGPAYSLAMVILGTIIVLRSSNRRVGWLVVTVGFSLSIISFAADYSQYALLVAPQDSPPLGSLAGWLQDLWTIPLMLQLFLLPVIFPDGGLPSPRWRAIFWLGLVCWILFIVVFAFARRPLANVFLDLETPPPNPYGFFRIGETAINAAFAVLAVVSVMTGMGSVIYRWRRAGSEVRQQIKWVLYSLLVMLGFVGATIANSVLMEGFGIDLGLERSLSTAGEVLQFGFIAALGIALFRYRLYDIDLIINRTLVYGGLTVVIVATYVLLVAGLGALLPLEDNLFLSLLATGVIAVLFNPLRIRLQRAANRLMFGRRDDPYAVLSELGRRLSSSSVPDATLQTVAETIATALKLPYAAIQLEQGGAYQTRAEYGATAEHSAAAGSEMALPLVHQKEVVGRLVVAPRAPGESLAPRDRQLLEDIAHQAGAVAHAVRLTAALQRSREMLVLAREEERRRIRRDLHDGLGPSLASQTFKLDAALDLLQDDPRAAARQLETLKAQNQRLVAEIRRLVYELRPPALDELGLAGALAAHAGQLNGARGLQIKVVTMPDPLPTLPAAVEVAAYRIALEAITNAVRHAQARACTVTLEATDGRLALTVGDDGVGLAPGTEPGVGLFSMRERAEELGGSIEIVARPPRGTRVTAVLPGQAVQEDAPVAMAAGDGERHG